MKNLWNSKFEWLEIETPKDILNHQCSELGKLTKERVIAKITEYDGHILSYYKKNPFNIVSKMLEEEYVDIQDELGASAESNFTFEFFITSASTPNYKYRIMFFQYGIDFYPVTIVLDEAIAEELKIEQNTICSSQDEFEDILKKILNSKKMEKVIRALMTIVEKEGISF
ncbi:MAG: hypothetical protein FWC13_13350 [Oscillospiraceae bacterium]|nr:hypothetical protein [Oscillospiraceae bacterium]